MSALSNRRRLPQGEVLEATTAPLKSPTSKSLPRRPASAVTQKRDVGEIDIIATQQHIRNRVRAQKRDANGTAAEKHIQRIRTGLVLQHETTKSVPSKPRRKARLAKHKTTILDIPDDVVT